MMGAVPTIEAALEMDEVMRSAAVIITRDIEAAQRKQAVQAFGIAIGMQ